MQEGIKARAKSSGTPHPVWVEGRYVTDPPRRPSGGEERPTGHYIDRGGCPGADVYEVSMETLCRGTGAADRNKCSIYENDILLYDAGEETGYLIVYDTENAVDIISGEVTGISRLHAHDIKVIGSMIDFPDFADGIRYCAGTGMGMPYLPALNVMGTPYPFFKMTCLKCGHTTYSCIYTARHRGCGGYMAADYAAEVCRKGEQKEKAPAL